MQNFVDFNKGSAAVGILGEVLASEHLEKLGYNIIDRNVNFKHFGELDIVATDGTELVFVEVKTRSDVEFGHPIDALSASKIRKLIKCAELYLEVCPVAYTSIRFDVVCVSAEEVEHVKDAFYGNWH